ncbi:MAG TPA: SCO family protein [Azospirillum sp.]|nr:SCO family protein [Azospirillum sp.]
MNTYIAAVAATLLALSMSSIAQAHSLNEVEHSLSSKDQYVEVVNRPAPGFRLTDTDGHTVSLDDLKGKVVALWFIYTNCPDVCPLHTEAIASIQRAINATPMKDRVRFVAITTDPERDTPTVLKEYGPAHGLDPANAILLTSAPEAPTATRGLAEQYGLKFTATPDGMQMHALVMHLIDREGNLRARYHGLKFDPTSAIVHINALTNDGLIKDHHGPKDRHGREPSLWERIKSVF